MKLLGCMIAAAVGFIAAVYVVVIFTLIKLIHEDTKKFWKR